MRITSSKVDNFLKQPDVISGVLIYGSDNSKIDFYVKKLITNLTGYSIQVMDFTVVNRSPDLLLSELLNISMFYNKKLIKLINVSGSISKELRNVIDYNIGNHYIIMVANELSYDSTIKSYMENSKLFGIVTCYKNSSDNLYNIIKNYLEQNDVKHTKELINYLQFYFNNNKTPICAELEKLLLYLGERKELKLTDIEECFSVSGNNYVTFDNLYSAIAKKDVSNFIRISDILINNNNFSPIAIIRIIFNYFLRLESVLLLIDSGISEQNAISQLNPPLFFKQIQQFTSHLKLLHLSELKMILGSLINLEIMCKRTNLNNKMLFQHIMSSLFIPQDSSEIFIY